MSAQREQILHSTCWRFLNQALLYGQSPGSRHSRLHWDRGRPARNERAREQNLLHQLESGFHTAVFTMTFTALYYPADAVIHRS
jgi:hypothetical protein